MTVGALVRISSNTKPIAAALALSLADESYPIDALAIARAALREPNLPVADHDTWCRGS